MLTQKNTSNLRAFVQNEFLGAFVSLLVAFTGLTVMYGWLVENTLLITIHPDFSAMVFNTALGFFLTGLGISFLIKNQFSAASFLGGLIFFLGLITLYEYQSGHNLGIDEFLFKDFVLSNTEHPGRMSIATAICFAITGGSLLAVPALKKSVYFLIILEFFLILASVISLISLADQFGIVDTQYSYIIWDSMAIHTSLGFVISNFIILRFFWFFRRGKSSIFKVHTPAFLLSFALIFDMNTSLAIAAGFAYQPFVLCSFWQKDNYTSFIYAFVASLLVIAGFFLIYPVEGYDDTTVINRSITIFGLWITAWLVFHIKGRERKIQEDRNIFRAVLDNTVDGIITIDQFGIVESYNKACERIFGYSPDEVIGQNIKMLMPDPYHSEHDTYLKNYNDTGHKTIIGVGREVRGKRKDGSTFPLDLSVSEVTVQGRKLYTGITRDITVRKQAEDEIMRSNEELERFAYIASHDLQEPLRMVANFTTLLNDEYREKFDEQAGQYMNFITGAAKRMQALVSDLLEYSRVGYEDAGATEIDAQALAELAVENLSEIINDTDAKVSINQLPIVHANPVRFSRLLQNLIGNGIKYRTKDRTPKIEVNVREQDNEWVFCVSDNGIGIKEEYLEQIFVIFKRLHGKDEYSGTGIGLAVCQKIVQNFNGKIWAESKYGHGTEFYFTIPKSNASGDKNG